MQSKRIFTKPLVIAGLVVGSAFMSLSATGYAQSAQNGAEAQHRHGQSAAMQEQRLEKLKSDLQLQPNQQGAWETYTTALKSLRDSRKAQWQQAKAQPAATLPDRLDQRVTFAKQREADLETMVSATKQFYSTLTPAQRTIMDQRATHGRGAH
jgi:periplasmic protein CpxP/Spy